MTEDIKVQIIYQAMELTKLVDFHGDAVKASNFFYNTIERLSHYITSANNVIK